MGFKVGQRVVCIEAPPNGYGYYASEKSPKKGDMLTIRTVEDSQVGCSLRFKELINPILRYTQGYYECQFRSFRFRPLDEDFADEVLEKVKEEINQENLVDA